MYNIVFAFESEGAGPQDVPRSCNERVFLVGSMEVGKKTMSLSEDKPNEERMKPMPKNEWVETMLANESTFLWLSKSFSRR